MNKFTALSILVILIAGCASQPDKEETSAPSKPEPALTAEQKKLEGAPAWVLTPKLEGYVAIAASAPKTVAGFDAQRTDAIENAMERYMLLLQSDIEKITEVSDNRAKTQFTEDFKSLRNDAFRASGSLPALRGYLEQETGWLAPNGTLHVLMKVKDQNHQRLLYEIFERAGLEKKSAEMQGELKNRIKKRL
mgnify:CR=1 FL=1